MPITEMMTITGIGLFFLLGFIYLLRLIQAWILHRTLREAIKRDSAQTGMLIDRIGRTDSREPRAANGTDDRTGLVLIALGIALAGFSLISGEPDLLQYGTGAALFPILVGAALLLRHYKLSRTAEPDVAPRA